MGGQRAKASEEAPSGFRRLRAFFGVYAFSEGCTYNVVYTWATE